VSIAAYPVSQPERIDEAAEAQVAKLKAWWTPAARCAAN
jgi:valyl-tRNA synthetase